MLSDIGLVDQHPSSLNICDLISKGFPSGLHEGSMRFGVPDSDSEDEVDSLAFSPEDEDTSFDALPPPARRYTTQNGFHESEDEVDLVGSAHRNNGANGTRLAFSPASSSPRAFYRNAARVTWSAFEPTDAGTGYEAWLRRTEHAALREGQRNASRRRKTLTEIAAEAKSLFSAEEQKRIALLEQETTALLEALAIRSKEDEAATLREFEERKRRLWEDIDAAIAEVTKKQVAITAAERRLKGQSLEDKELDKQTISREQEATRKAQEKLAKQNRDRAAAAAEVEDAAAREAREAESRKAVESENMTAKPSPNRTAHETDREDVRGADAVKQQEVNTKQAVAEAEARRLKEEAKRKHEEEAKRLQEEQWRAQEEAKRAQEAEAKRKQEEAARRAQEADARRVQEEERRRAQEAEAKRAQEAEARRVQEEAVKRAKEAEAKKAQEAQARAEAARAEQAARASSSTTSETEWRYWAEKQKWMKSEVIEKVKADRATRTALKISMRLITRGIGQATNKKEDVKRLVSDFDRMFCEQLSTRPSPANPTKMDASSSVPYLYLLSHASKTFIRQAETEVSARTEAAFPLARIIVSLILHGHAAFGEVLFARFVKKCPWVIPHCPRKQPDQSREAFEKSTGRSVNESIADWIQRMAGTSSLYFAILQTPLVEMVSAYPSNPVPTPHQLAVLFPPAIRFNAAWTWLASAAHHPMPAYPPIAHLVSCWLEILGGEVARVFGTKQLAKVMQALAAEGLQGGKLKGDSEASKQKLGLLLEDWHNLKPHAGRAWV